MYKVVISPSANADLFNALKYIAFELENPQAVYPRVYLITRIPYYE